MHAVIATGGKQYRVTEGEVLSVERLEAEVGRKIDFDHVLLVEDGEKILVGTPDIKGAVVTAEVLEFFRDDKVLVFRKKKRKQFRRTRGHRQDLLKVRIDAIWAEGKPASVIEAEAKAAALPVPAKPAPAPKAAKVEVKEEKKEEKKAPKAKKVAPAAEAKKPAAKKAAASKPAAPKKEAKKE